MPNLFLKKTEGEGYWDIEVGTRTKRVTGTEHVAQLVKARLQTMQGEWEKNQTVGVPWLRDVFIKNYDIVLVEAHIAKTIISTEGVKELINISSTVDRVRRMLHVSFEAVSIYDESFTVSAQL